MKTATEILAEIQLHLSMKDVNKALKTIKATQEEAYNEGYNNAYPNEAPML